MKKIIYSRYFFLKTKLIYFLDFLHLIQFFTFIRALLLKLKVDNFSLSQLLKISKYFLKPTIILRDSILHRKLNIYEVDTIFLLKNLPLNEYELILEIGACYGFFTRKILKEISKSNSSYHPTIISVEPSSFHFEKYLIPIKNQIHNKFFLINDYAGEKCSPDNAKFISEKIMGIQENKGFMFIDVDFEGSQPYELTFDILKTFNLQKFNSILVELGNSNPFNECLKLKKSLLYEFCFIRISKKRFLFIRK